MGHASTPEFQTFHALRIKGFATVDTLVEMTTQPKSEVEAQLGSFAESSQVQFRENRGLWQLTPDGRAAHTDLLAADLAGIEAAQVLGAHYEPFVEINVGFKELCSEWQLREGAPNDHSDAEYDAGVVARLAELNAAAQPVVAAMGVEIDRLSPYAPRLEATLTRVQAGESSMFTGVMCGSFHDVWMELHEDLILTQGIDRAAEGSF
jgi:hypothetical protein